MHSDWNYHISFMSRNFIISPFKKQLREQMNLDEQYG